MYRGTAKKVGALTCPGWGVGEGVKCVVPGGEVVSCTSKHSLDADDWVGIVYCEWVDRVVL